VPLQQLPQRALQLQVPAYITLVVVAVVVIHLIQLWLVQVVLVVVVQAMALKILQEPQELQTLVVVVVALAVEVAAQVLPEVLALSLFDTLIPIQTQLQQQALQLLRILADTRFINGLATVQLRSNHGTFCKT
jgi:hypothetical protein